MRLCPKDIAGHHTTLMGPRRLRTRAAGKFFDGMAPPDAMHRPGLPSAQHQYIFGRMAHWAAKLTTFWSNQPRGYLLNGRYYVRL